MQHTHELSALAWIGIWITILVLVLLFNNQNKK